MNSTLIIFSIFAIGFISIATFVKTDNKSANKVIFFGAAFLGSMILYFILGTYFILNDYSFEMGYHEASRLNPIAFENYRNFSWPFIIILMSILFYCRKIFKGPEMFAAKVK